MSTVVNSEDAASSFITMGGGIVKLRKCVAVALAYLTLPNLRSCVLATAFAESEDEHEYFVFLTGCLAQ